MEPSKHHKINQRMRKLRKQKSNLHRTRHNRSIFNKRRQTYHPRPPNKLLKPKLLNLHKRGYNLLGYSEYSKQTTRDGLVQGNTIFNFHKCYLMKSDGGKSLLAFILLFMFYRRLFVVHIWNIDILSKVVAILFCCQLVQGFVYNCYVIQWLIKMLSDSLSGALSAVPAIRKCYKKYVCFPSSCRQQHLKVIRTEETLSLFLLAFIVSLLSLVRNLDACHKSYYKQGRCRQYKQHYRFTNKHLRSNMEIGQWEDIRKHFRNGFLPHFSNALTYPIHDDLSGFCKSMESQPPPSTCELLLFEWYRFTTFSSCDQQINAIKLARNGFYFAGNAENPRLTRCYCCQLESSDWDYFSDVEQFHRNKSPGCTHITPSIASQTGSLVRTGAVTSHQDANSSTANGSSLPAFAVGTIPKRRTHSLPQSSDGLEVLWHRDMQRINQAPAINSLSGAESSVAVSGTDGSPNGRLITTSPSTTCSVTGRHNNPLVTAQVEKQQRHSIKHPQYQNFEARLRSFHNWPLQIEPSPRRLAEAGFFYTGEGDMVRCFYCGVGCYEWSDGENAWMEHGVGNIECPHLKQFKDSTFFERATRKMVERRRGSRRPRSSSRIQVPEQDVDPMSTRTAILLLQRDMNPILVRQAVQHVWREKGSFQDDPHMAMNWCLDQQAKETQFAARSDIPFGKESASLSISRSVTPAVISSDDRTNVYQQVTSIVTMTTSCSTSCDTQTGVISLASAAGSSADGQETAPKEVQDFDPSRQSHVSVVMVTATSASSQVSATSAPPIYTAAGQHSPTDPEHDLKITQVIQTLLAMGFTYKPVLEELNQLEEMKDLPVEEMVEKVVITITDKMRKVVTRDYQSTARHLADVNCATTCTSHIRVNDNQAIACQGGQGLSDTAPEQNMTTVPAVLTQDLNTESTPLETTTSLEASITPAGPSSAGCASGNMPQPLASEVKTLSVKSMTTGTVTSSCTSVSSHTTARMACNVQTSPLIHGDEMVVTTEVTGHLEENGGVTAEGATDINSQAPKHPSYAEKSVRLESYASWPQTRNQDPSVLAEAGFFYTGVEDCVRCFYCDGGLKHWATEDNPWIEHARCAQTCSYLRRYKGDEFINRAITQDEETGASVEKSAKKKKKRKGKAKSTENSQDAPIDCQVLGDLMMKLVQMGSDVKKVKEKTDVVKEENERLKEEKQCKVCMDREVAIVFLPCGHLVTCEVCAKKVKECPLCRAKIMERTKTFSS